MDSRQSERSQPAAEEGGRRRPGSDGPPRRGSWWLLLIAGLLLIWALSSVSTVLAAERDLESARQNLFDAEQELRDADLDAARLGLIRAAASSEVASTRLGRPYLIPLRIIPFVGSNLRAAETLSDAVGSVGDAAVGVLDAAASTINNNDERQEPSEVTFGNFEDLRAPLKRLSRTLEDSMDVVADLDPSSLVERVANARLRFLDVAQSNIDDVRLAADVVEVLPMFLGNDEPRTYLIGAAALSELRGSGGLPGSWSLVRVHEGRLDFETFTDVDELPAPEHPVDAPSADFARRYARYGSLISWRNANITPDFPAAADVLMQLYEDGGGATVDGVIMADTMVFQRLAESRGGLQVAGAGFLTPEETLKFVGLDAYAEFDDEIERKRALGAAATAAFSELFDLLDGEDIRSTAGMLGSIASGDHLRVSVRDEQVQDVLERAGFTGDLAAVDGEAFGVFANNFSQNKVDYFSHLTVEHHIRLTSDGTTRATIDGEIRNDSPTEGYPRGVLGPWLEDTEPGDNVFLFTASCSRTCRFTSRPEDAVDGGLEHGRPMADQLVHLPSDESFDFRYETLSEGGWRDEGGRAIVDVRHRVQPRIKPSTLLVRIDVPEGFEAVDLPTGAQVEDGQVVWEEPASGLVELSISFAPID